MREVLLNDFTSGNHSADFVDFERSQTQSLASRPKSTKNHESNTANLNHSEKQTQETTQSEVIADSSPLVRSTSPNLQQDNAKTKIITLHSKYGNKKATFETTSAVIMLPLTKGGEYFVFDDVRFFVIAGEGALYYLDCVKAFDFTNLEAECLERFLLTGKQPRDYKQRELIKDFLDIDTKNIQKGKMYLLPKGYEMIAQSLIQGN